MSADGLWATVEPLLQEPTTYTITASAGPHGSISPSGATVVASGGSRSYTITPDLGYQVDDVLVDGVSVGAVTSYDFNNVTAGHTISAGFSLVHSGFSDVSTANPYYEAIQSMATAGIIGGYEDGTFRPLAPVWRAQFAKMVTGALALPVAEGMTSPFTDLGVDLSDSLYPHECVAAAYAAGITQGLSATTFGPWNDISRAQVITMVVRAVQSLHPGVLQAVPGTYVNTWGTGFSPIHGTNARVAEYNGLLDGLPLAGTSADPWGPMARGEVAQVVWNMMQMLD
jgi:hypothetical protein